MEVYENEIEIDFTDFFTRVIRRWKIVMIVALAGAFLGVVLFFLRMPKSNVVQNDTPETIRQNYEDNLQKRVEETKGALSNTESLQVELAIKANDSYVEAYADQLEYVRDSIYLSMDANAVPTLMNTYLISNYNDEDSMFVNTTTQVDNIILMYQRNVPDEELNTAIAEAIGTKDSANYVRELYSFSKHGKSMMTVNVFAKSEKDCKTIMDILDEKIMRVSNENRRYIAHDIELVSSFYSEAISTGLFDSQKAWVDKLSSIKNSMLSVPGYLKDSQKEYYLALSNLIWYEAGLVSDEEIGITKDLDGSMNEYSSSGIETFNKRKFLICLMIGFIFGALIPIFWMLIRYIFTRNLRTPNDLKKVFGLNTIGTISKGKNQISIDMISSELMVEAVKRNAKRIVFWGTIVDQSVKDTMDVIKKSTNCVDIVIAGSAIEDPKAMETAASSDGIVFFERVDISKYKDIEKEIEFCKNCGIDMLGAVVLTSE